MNYDTIFFDIGNTLFFFNYEFLRDLLVERFGISVTVSELEVKHIAARQSLISEKLMTLPHNELWLEAYNRWLASVGVEQDLLKTITDAIRSHPFGHLFWSRTEDGTREMLTWFKERGFKMGVISNAEGQIKRLIEHARMDNFFDVVVDSGVVGFNKPDLRIFKHAMNAIGASPAKSIHVGDLFEVDVAGARRAGITPVFVDPDGVGAGDGCLTVARAVDLPKLPVFSEDV